jgi:glycosyltransferase involved in cell wall biosynthesis
VDVDFFTPGPDEPGAYDLVVSALAPYKRVELVLEAYRGTGRPLKIVGSGPDRERLERVAPREAEFLGHVDDVRLRELYRGCRAVIMASVEDFGIVPLEAMACGRPAIVFGDGGGPESIVEDKTGLIFREATPRALRETVDALQPLGFNRDALRSRAHVFSEAEFLRRFSEFASDVTHGAC